jgi:ABC-type branched-subunit amino acid transport system substrate-binding protein
VEPGVLSVLQTLMPIMEKQPPLAVIGPTGNDENAAISLYSRCEHFPFVAPFSSQNGLASLSPYAFQINPDAETKGTFLADYAVHELGLKTFAILAPADNYGEAIAHSFQQTVEANGGEVVEVQWFYEDAQDFSRQLKAIRKKGFYIAFRDSVRQVDSTLSDQEIQQKFKQYMTEVLFSSDLRGKVDSTQVPSTGIDGVFIAIYPDLIPFISSQFVFQNIQTTLLGNEGWYDPEQLIQQSNYLNGLIFITAGYLDKESWNYREFTTRFRTVMHQTPDRYHLLGYDIAKWMMTNYQPGMDRQAFRDKLESAGTYRGILEDIVFKQKPRVNSSLNVIKFQMGQLIKLK